MPLQKVTSWAGRPWLAVMVIVSASGTGVTAPPPLSDHRTEAAAADQAGSRPAPSLPMIERHLRGGEFVAARAVAERLTGEDRDAALARIGQSQVRIGARVAAIGTLRDIATPAYRTAVTNEIAGTAFVPTPDAPRRAGSESSGAAPGGSSFADFDSLMQLIQTTVEPDSWEALGGPSTMAPYPQGIWVDPAGTVRDVMNDSVRSEPWNDVQRLLADEAEPASTSAAPGQWRRPASLRVVSLRRLRDEITRRQLLGVQLSESMLHLAGVSEVTHIALVDDDVLVAGPVGGVASVNGWLVDAATGGHPLRLDFLHVSLRAALDSRPFGCTIDPSPEGLARAQHVGAEVKQGRVPIGLAANRLAAALGPQRVEVFGTAGDSSVALLMVEVDRHMKQLALGVAEMPEGVKNYPDFIDEMIANGPPAEVLIRLWFTTKPQQIEADRDGRLFRLSGRPIRLSSQNQRAAPGREVIADDPRTVAFVDEFNHHFEKIRAQYPAYGAIESLYRTAAVAALGVRFGADESTRHLLESIGSLESAPQAQLVNPATVDSIATLHTVRHGRSVHRILLASGGVLIDLNDSLVRDVQTYPGIGSVGVPSKDRPLVAQRWWWNATND